MKKRNLVRAAAALGALVLASGTVSAGEWPNFRGEQLTGAAQAGALPAQWSTEEGTLWSAKLPGVGSATPAVWGERIFLTAADAQTGELSALCLSTRDGAVLWQRAHGQNRKQGAGDMTSPSPVTDGQRVIFTFADGQVAAYDFEGELLWRRQLAEEFGVMSWLFGYGASPLLHDGRLYLQMMRRPTHRSAPEAKLESYLLALDPASGKEMWRHTRPGEAMDESWESYITPSVHRTAAGTQIVLAGADAITGHDAVSGAELWRANYNARRQRNWRLVPTPLSDGERLYTALPRGVEFVAIEPQRGTVAIEDWTKWTLAANAPDVCSPLLYDGRLYLLDGDRRVVTCLNPESGQIIWRGELGGSTVIRSSPTAGDGKIYFMDERGLVYVIAAGDAFEVLARIEMGGPQPARSSIVIAGERLYVRTGDRLWAVGK